MDYPGKVITKTQVTPTQTSASGNWTLDDQAAAIKNNNWPVALVPNPISKSLRFNSADSAYLNRTPASAGNRKTWTWSSWVKRGALGSNRMIFNCDNGTTDATFGSISFLSSDSLNFGAYNLSWRVSTQVFRDPSAWYHIVVAFDTTQATAANRVKMYVNGVQITAFSTSNDPTLNTDYAINQAAVHNIGKTYGGFGYWDGYLTEVNFIDGQALDPTSFGMTNPQTGQWIPLKYSGTYGTNGFYLNFKDATSTTTLGYDYSGNANNWTTNNFSVTAGAGNDSLTDVPTPWFAYNTTGDVGGVIRGNYCTLNSVDNTGVVITNGNLTGTTPGSNVACKATMTLPTTGKWYFEATDVVTGGNNLAGIANVTLPTNISLYLATGSIWVGMSDNATFGFALNFDALTYTIYKNNSVNSSGSITSGITYVPFMQTSSSGGASTTFNFGQRPFAYTPPTGFRSLCTTNLPATAIGFGLTNQGDDYFNPVLYTGTGAARSITGVGFAPNFVWIKVRDAAYDHQLYDIIRGAGKYLYSNSTVSEQTDINQLSSFDSDGFSLGSAQGTNESAKTFVAWNWKAGGTGVSNTAGTITSTVSANTTSGFSIVTYTGNDTSGATVGHGLGVAPSMFIVKTRSQARGWNVYHTSIGNTKYIQLQSTAATVTSSAWWNNTSPSSTTFTLGNDPDVNGSTQNYVAYCFAAVPGYSAFGSYTGNGSTDGPFVYLGFRPEFIMTRSTSGSREWYMYDAARDTYNVATNYLRANTSAAAGSFTSYDMVSNGFKLRSSDTAFNGSGETYIYMAFAESPFQFANAR